MGNTRWNAFDTAYCAAGALVLLCIWAAYGPRELAVFGGLLVMAYAAGRAAGSHR